MDLTNCFLMHEVAQKLTTTLKESNMAKRSIEFQFDDKKLHEAFKNWFAEDGEEMFYDWVMNMTDDIDDFECEYDLENDIIEVK